MAFTVIAAELAFIMLAAWIYAGMPARATAEGPPTIRFEFVPPVAPLSRTYPT